MVTTTILSNQKEKMERFNWQEIISVNIFLLRFVGLWPKETYNLNLYTLYAVVFFGTVHAVFQTISTTYLYSNLEALTESVIFCAAEYLTLLKIYTFMVNIKKLKSLLLILDSDIFQPSNFKQVLLVWPAIKVWKTIYQVLLGTACLSICLWLSIKILNGSGKKLPFEIRYPYNTELSVYYKLTYLHQAFAMSFFGLAAYNIDMLISALMMYVGAQCDILCDHLRNLEGNSNDFQKTLKRCVFHHKQILRFAENCNDFFNVIMLGQFFTTLVGLAIVLFQLALLTLSGFSFYKYFFSIVVLTTQIFNYCWFGEEVNRKSNRIAYAAFESTWIEQDSPAKRSLVIFTERALVPINLSTFSLFYLSHETFVKILRSAVSYYAVLRQLDGLK